MFKVFFMRLLTKVLYPDPCSSVWKSYHGTVICYMLSTFMMEYNLMYSGSVARQGKGGGGGGGGGA